MPATSIGDLPAAPEWTEIDWSGEVEDARIDGRRVRYVVRGAGSAIVLIHGLGGSWQTWLQNIPTLALEHRVLAVDLPGFGRSDPLPAPAEMATHAEVIAELLDGLGITAATVVGHSMGGLVSIALLGRRPDLVARLVLADGGGVPLTRLRLAAIVNAFKVVGPVVHRPNVIRAIARRPRLRRLVFGAFLVNHDALSGRFAGEVVPAIAAPGLIGAVLAASNVADRIDPGAIRCPVLLLWGESDRILPLAQAREMCRSLLDARLVVIERSGHCPMFEAPRQFNRALLSFARS
jgi:pimeloyl-ACP methyl ester carboxylesterase